MKKGAVEIYKNIVVENIFSKFPLLVFLFIFYFQNVSDRINGNWLGSSINFIGIFIFIIIFTLIFSFFIKNKYLNSAVVMALSLWLFIIIIGYDQPFSFEWIITSIPFAIVLGLASTGTYDLIRFLKIRKVYYIVLCLLIIIITLGILYYLSTQLEWEQFKTDSTSWQQWNPKIDKDIAYSTRSCIEEKSFYFEKCSKLSPEEITWQTTNTNIRVLCPLCWECYFSTEERDGAINGSCVIIHRIRD